MSWSDSPRLGQDGDTAYSETLPPLGPRREVRFLSGFVPPERSIDDQRQQKVETKRNPPSQPYGRRKTPAAWSLTPWAPHWAQRAPSSAGRPSKSSAIAAYKIVSLPPMADGSSWDSRFETTHHEPCSSDPSALPTAENILDSGVPYGMAAVGPMGSPPPRTPRHIPPGGKGGVSREVRARARA